MSGTLDEKQIFSFARQLESEKAVAEYLEQVCRGDRALRARILQLLKDDKADSFLQGAPLDLCEATESVESDELQGQTVGNYKLLEKIGEGGFGAVYMADQLRPIRRRVALKIIKLGMDTKQVIARFEAERQALAMMDHPNIAKILDAGTTAAGRPYFVMELVRGVPITEFCDDRGLSTDDRLGLFGKVCSAVQHAHQKGIIHRDIKPSNVLVSTIGDEAIPKVIDFGIAKATHGQLTDKTVFTQFRQFIGTPAYMSPEQAQMSAVDVDTRSDVYSLGVLLYQLLTGTTPLDSSELVGAGFDEICRRIREDEAPKPSKRLSSLQLEARTGLADTRGLDAKSLESKLQGELDWVVMKAIEKDRRRRYDSAGALEGDVKRYLGKEPVSAVPPSSLYLFSKFIRRHRVATLTIAAIAGSLLIGSSLALIGTLEALEQRDLAEDSRHRLELQVTETNIALKNARRLERRALQTTYLADMHAGHQALEAHNLRLAKQILSKHADYTADFDPRNFEYQALWLRCKGQAEHSFSVPNNWVSPLSVSHDGEWLAGYCQNGITKIWSTSDWETDPVVFEGPEIVEFSPAASRLYGVQGGEIRSWHWPSLVQTDEVLRVESPIRKLCISPNGQILATLGVGDPPGSGPAFVTIYDLSSGAQRHRFKSQGALGSGGRISISADSSKIALGFMQNTRVFDVDTLDDTLNIDRVGRGAARLSPDGKWILTNGGLIDRLIHVRRASDGEIVTQLQGHDLGVREIRFSPDGKLVASASSDQTVRLWDTKTWTQVKVLSGHSCTVRKLVFTPDGKQLISFGRPAEFCVWNLEVDTDETWPICKTDLVAGDWTDNYPRHVAAFSFDSKRIAIRDTDDGVTLLSATSLERIRSLPSLGQDVHSVRFSPCEPTLAVGFQDGSFTLVDPSAPQSAVRKTVMPGWKVATTGFSADGSRLLLVAKEPGASRCRCIVYSVREHRTLAAWDVSQPMYTASISPCGETVMVGFDGEIRLWSLAAGELRRFTLDSGGQEVAMSPDGKHLLMDGRFDRVGVVDVAARQLIDYLVGHRYNVASLQFSPDGRRVAVGANDVESLKIWDFGTRRELLTLSTTGWYHQNVEWSPDGNAIFLLGGGGRISLWRVPSLEQIKSELIQSLNRPS